MRYLITSSDILSPGLTNWFDPVNHFNSDLNMIVYDLLLDLFTIDGINWLPITIDHL